MNRYVRLGETEDIDKASRVIQDVIAGSPANDPETPSRLSNLSLRYYSLFAHSGRLGELEKAIQTGKQVIAATTPNHPVRMFVWQQMSVFLESRYDHSHNYRDLLEAGCAGAEAEISTPPDHPNYPDVQFQLATLNMRSNARLARHRFVWVLHCELARPETRILAASLAADILISRKRWDVAYSILEYAIKLLPRVCPRFLSRNDQLYKMSQITQLAAKSISVAIHAGATPSQIICLFELCRGIIQGFTIDCRNDLSKLEEKYPTIFYKFNNLRFVIDMEMPQEKSLLPA